MPSSCPSEERFPLLLFFLEDGQQSSKHRRILIDKTRYQGITSGASAVITQWPGHLTTCWLTALIIGLAIVLVSMMMFAVTMRPGAYLLSARCKTTHVPDRDNHTARIHLVHGATPWMQSQLDGLEEIAQNYPDFHIDLIVIQNEINFVSDNDKNFSQTQPGYYNDYEPRHVETPVLLTTSEDVKNYTTSLFSSTSENSTGTPAELKRVKRIKRHLRLKRKTHTIIRKKRLYPWENIQLSINIGTKKLLRMFLNRKVFEDSYHRYKNEKFTSTPPQLYTFQDIIKIYPNIHVKNLTYEEAFKNSPLHFSWQNLNQVTRLFAIRVLQMWNYAGITFELPEFPKIPETSKISLNTTRSPPNNASNNNHATNSSKVIKSFAENEGKYKKLIIVGLPAFEQLPEGLVTVDDNGLHMETKTVCHAFFGEILISFKKATLDTMPADIIKKTLRTFCTRGAVDSNYCKSTTT